MSFSFPTFPVSTEGSTWVYGANSADTSLFMATYSDGTTVFAYNGNISISTPNEYHSLRADGSESHNFADGSRLYVSASGTSSLYNADGSGYWVNANGSMTLFDGAGHYTSLDANGVQTWSNITPALSVAHSGSQALEYLNPEPPAPPEPQEIQLDDGSIQTTLEDGSVKTTQPDGSYKIDHADGSTEEGAGDGSYTLTMTDGSIKTVDTLGNYTTQYSDGTTETGDETGAYTHTLANGAVETGDADGNVTTTQPDGHYTIAYADGRSEVGDGNGTVTLTAKDGSYETTTPDGVVETGDGQGTITLTQPDGSYRTDHADGAVTVGDGLGTETTTQSDGSYVTDRPDGSVEAGQADGSYVREYASGRVDTVHADGSGFTTYTSSEYAHDDQGHLIVIESEIQVGLGESLGAGLGTPSSYFTFGTTAVVTYPDGTHYQTAIDNIDYAWQDGLPGPVTDVRTDYHGNVTYHFAEGGDITGLVQLTSGGEFVTYAPGFTLDDQGLLGSDGGMPAAYSVTDGQVSVTYADGHGFTAPADTVDVSFLDTFPEGVESLHTDWQGNIIADYPADSTLVDTVILSPDGEMFIDYQPGVTLDPPVGQDLGMPISFHIDGDMVSVRYADGTGYQTEASNVDMSWRDELPDGENITSIDTSYGTSYIDWAPGSDVASMAISNSSVDIKYTDGSYETQYASGSMIAVSADGVRYTLHSDGTSTLYNPHTGETHSNSQEGEFSLVTSNSETPYSAMSLRIDDDGAIRYSDDTTGDWASVADDGGYIYNINGVEQSNHSGNISHAEADGSFTFTVPTGGFAFGSSEATLVGSSNRFDGSLEDLYSASGTHWNLETNEMSIPEKGIFSANVGGLLKAAVTGSDEEIDLGISDLPNPSDYPLGGYPEGNFGTITINDDGSQTLARADGYTFTWHTDGHGEGICPDGATQEFYPNAVGAEPSYVYHFPDGVEGIPTAATFTQNADGSAHFDSGDGQITDWTSYPAEEGTVMTWQMQDGSYGTDTYIQDGGHIRVAQLPNGQEPTIEIWESNGIITTNVQKIDEAGFTINSDGSMSIDFDPDLVTRTGYEFPDTMTLQAPPESLADPIQIPFPAEPEFDWEQDVDIPSFLSENNFFDPKDEQDTTAENSWAHQDPESDSDDLGIVHADSDSDSETDTDDPDHDALDQALQDQDQHGTNDPDAPHDSTMDHLSDALDQAVTDTDTPIGDTDHADGSATDGVDAGTLDDPQDNDLASEDMPKDALV